jgi:hypothetical protein
VKSLRKIILVLAALAVAPAKIFACAACYANGANINDPMTAGMNWAIFTLGVVVATVLGVFLTFLIHVIRKSEALEAAAQKNSVADLRSSQGDEAQTKENTEPDNYGIEMGTPEPSKI